MKIICRCVGGSRMYGLETPDSDEDFRGIFLNTNLGTILGLDRYEHQDLRADGQDVFLWEFRHFLNSLRKTNTQSLELLFNEEWIIIEEEFKVIQKCKYQLLDSQKLHKSLIGYMYGEAKLANGDRTGNMGSKRRNALEKYGFSPKNYSNLFRLAHCGIRFFEMGYFPTNIKRDMPELASELLELKMFPERFDKNDLTLRYSDCILKVNQAFDKRNFDYKFDVDLANDLILSSYFPILEQYHNLKGHRNV